MAEKQPDELQRDRGAIWARLQEAEEIIRAIREGEIDAVAIGNPQRGAHPQIHMLSGSEEPYCILVETMSEGAVTLNPDARVLYSNPAFARLVGRSPDELVNTAMPDYVMAADRPLFDALLRRGIREDSKGEVSILSPSGVVPVLLSFGRLKVGDLPCACLIVTDLREQRRNQEILAAERLTNSILDQAAEAIIVCDEAGMVTRANQQAQRLAVRNPLLAMFDESFPLFLAPSGPPLPSTAAVDCVHIMDILRGKTFTSREVVLKGSGDVHSRPMLLSAGPLRAADQNIIGCVVNLTDITERKKAEQALADLLLREQKARAEAQMANQAKDIFLATLSHELRTPLSAVLGWVRLLREAPTPQLSAQAVEVIERNARAQAQLIDDILDISRIISGKITLEMKLIQLPPIVNAAMESVRLAAEAKGIQLKTQILDENALVLGDSGRIQQVVWNLLSNATKFTPRGGCVEIAAGCDHQHAYITVSDTGQGIPADFLPFVFDRFRQADGSTTRRHGGLGLGLAIVRHVVEMHGGTVAVESPGPGLGSTFTVRLPAAASDLDFGGALAQKGKAGIPPEVDPTLLKGVRILLVDDQADTLTFLAVVLRQRGAQVTTAHSAEGALEFLLKDPPDVLISDIAMPGGDGYHLIQDLRAYEAANPALARTPAIALTAFARTADANDALRSGFQKHISKPVDVGELSSTILYLANARSRGA